ncbi:hypothetical protein [Pseudoponticoccus marisrubri]|uniref:KfrA N-terminal DNA-binding domain-containing protein n=1 Tax=Pseudoponticoccus marisrubri TaxID=1685382 RepID=A0A0W7WL53_9RHOB|nr:hypothetical protein [Pseudoponticoccus marisrubri]KUF11347.1 hypothetical protein AVJ23_06135 [Pseudoponticoccus marisrubri]
MTEKRAGRPPKYTEAQVLAGIEIVERNGETPTGDTVKRAMCTQLDVAGGINAQSLDKEVQRLLEQREQQRRENLIGALPADARDAVKEIGALVEAAVLGHLGEQYGSLTVLSGKMVAELKTDLGNQREQIRELLNRIDSKDAEIADLEGKNHDLKQRLDARDTEVATLKARLSELERDEDFRARMIEVMKETLRYHATSDEKSPPVRA